MKHRRGRQQLPGYVNRALSASLKPGEVVQVVVAHASDCARLRGGECTCVPDLSAQFDDGRHADVDAAGQCGGEGKPS